jgi:hypothetical protein
MVKIPVAEPRQEPQIANMPNLVGDGFAAPGRAMQGLGSSIASLGAAIGDTLGNEYGKENDFNDKMAMLKFSNDIDRSEIENQSNYTGDGTGYAAARAEHYQGKADELLNQISPSGRQKAQLFIEQKRGAHLENAARFEGQQRQGAMVGSIKDAITGEYSKLTATDPADFDRNFELTQRGIDAIIDSAPLPQSVKEALRQDAASQAEALISGAGKDDPKAALMALPRIQKLIGKYAPMDRGNPGAEGVQGKPGSPSGPAAEKPSSFNAPSGKVPSFSNAVNGAIDKAAASAGVDPGLMRVFARIESSGNANARTGSYKGLFQLSNEEFEKYGGGDIYDAQDNANAAAKKFVAESARFESKYGRQPTAADLYMIHQQGEAGAREHWANPDAPAWENMAKASGKGARWAKMAIWGNVPSDMKHKFGSVDNVTSGDFVSMWNAKVAHWGGSTPGQAQPQQTAQQPAPGARAENTIPAGPVQVADASGRTVPQLPTAPMPQGPREPNTVPTSSVNSHLRERLIKNLPAYQRQFEGLVGNLVKDVETSAEKGYALPPEQMQETIDAVKASGSPELAQRLDSATKTAALMAPLLSRRPEEVQAFAANLRASMLKTGANAGTIEKVERIEKFARNIQENLDKNPITWGVTAGVIPEVIPITPETFSPDVLKQRAALANVVASYYGRPVQFFTPDERDSLKALTTEGGETTIKALGMMNDAFGPQMVTAMKELSKDAPEAASLGWLISQKANPQTINDLAQGLKLKRAEDFKPMGPSADLARTTALNVLKTAFRGLPDAEQNAISLANLLYEVRARQKGVVPGTNGAMGNPDLWTQGLKEILGENTDPVTKTTYGGVYEQGGFKPTWLGGHASQSITVPSNIKQDAIPDLINALKPGELSLRMPQLPTGATNAEGGTSGVPGQTGAQSGPSGQIGFPMDSHGRMLTTAQLRTATLVTVGDGRYVLAMGDPNGDAPDWVITNGPNSDRYGRFVLDLKAFEPVLRQRVPGAYRPY